jgi:hypothetical protein
VNRFDFWDFVLIASMLLLLVVVLGSLVFLMFWDAEPDPQEQEGEHDAETF